MSNIYPTIILHKDKEDALLRGHLWIFSGAIKSAKGNPKAGDVVEVFTAKGDYLATGHYQPNSSIAIRILTRVQMPIDVHFWAQKWQSALAYRQQLGLVDSPDTTMYRLIHAEGDTMPGLIADCYGDTLVLQAHTWGMYRARHEIAQAALEVLGNRIKAVYDKSSETLAADGHDGSLPTNEYLLGASSPAIERENGHRFFIDWEQGQKTGFFIDQRDNRQLLGNFAANKQVLNTFCYSGGFSIYALAAGAALVHSVDSSAKAISWTNQNVDLLGNNAASRHEGIVADVSHFLSQIPARSYDIVVLDPPAYAKHIQHRHRAIQAYKRLNIKGLDKVKSGGFLFTFSCSGVVDRALFFHTVVAAAMESGRQIRVVSSLSQPADHPLHLHHPQTEYLKGLLLYVE